MTSKPTEEQVKQSTLSYIKAWGTNPLPPTLLATLITAQHARPLQFIPLLFPPVLLFSTYLNVYDYKTDSAGLTAAWSGTYLLLARRRKQAFINKWGTRGIIRGATMGLCLANVVSGGWVYATGKRTKEEEGELV